MAWFTSLADKAENILTSLDEQTGAALRKHNGGKRIKPSQKTAASTDASTLKMVQRQMASQPKPKSPSPSSSKYSPRKLSPPTRDNNSKMSSPRISLKELPSKPSKIGPRQKNHNFNLDHSPKTLVTDITTKEDDFFDHFEKKKRRFTVPADLGSHQMYALSKSKRVEIENGMLKDELKLMNLGVTELLEFLHSTEEDLTLAKKQLEISEIGQTELSNENEVLKSQIIELAEKNNQLVNQEIFNLKQTNNELENRLEKLTEINNELAEKVKQSDESQANTTKMESELRQALKNVKFLEVELEKSKYDCIRLEKDWDIYKHRVKSMLQSKDIELKAFQEGLVCSEDTKDLMDQLACIREEREELLDVLTKVRSECQDMKQVMEELEARSHSSERLVGALREALREERVAKSKADTDCLTVKKEFKCFKADVAETISSLREQLREKEFELNKINEMSSKATPSDTSVFNVGDYDSMQESIANDKIQYLTQTLVGKQTKIDSLLADNNMLRIQLEKMELKYKKELNSRNNFSNSHSFVEVHDSEGKTKCRNKPDVPSSLLSRVSLRMAVVLKRHPLMRIFLFIYMIGLHMWVVLVLLSYTPENVAITRT